MIFNCRNAAFQTKRTENDICEADFIMTVNILIWTKYDSSTISKLCMQALDLRRLDNYVIKMEKLVAARSNT